MFSNLINLATSSLSDAITEFTSIFPDVWTFLTGNWYFSAMIIVPLAGLVISIILGFIRGSR